MAEVFLRKASGLVRDISARDVLFYNTGGINIGIGLGYVFLLGYAFYPGANQTLALALVTAIAVVQTLTYLFFTITMPRSGGEYMFMSRTLNPSLAFALSFSYALMMLFYSALAAAQFGKMGLATLFQVVAVKTGNGAWLGAAAWCQSPVGSFILGTILLALFGFILVREMKTYLRIQMWTWIVAILGLVAVIIVLALNSRETFTAAFNAYASGFINDANPYTRVITEARNAGFGTAPFSWRATLPAMLWPFFALAFGAQSASFAGEIRKVGRSQFIGTTGAVLLNAVFCFIIIKLANVVMGSEFLGAIAYNSFSAPAFSTPVTPWVHFLVALATNNWLLLSVIILGFIVWAYYWIPVNMLYVTRVVFAWSFDRLAPAKLGEVHRRYHTPANTIIVGTLITVLFLGIIVLTPYLQTLVGIVTMTLNFVFVGIAAMLFPILRKDLFSRTPVNYRLAGIPLMSILGLVTAVTTGVMCYELIVDPVAAGGTTSSLIFVFSQIILGFLIFFAAKLFRKRQGIDIDLAYREIPSE